jgi:four helix bundle protein
MGGSDNRHKLIPGDGLAFSTWHLAFSQSCGGADVKDFRDLKVWDRAHRLTLQVYRVTKGFPREELYGLTSQIRRCSASIAANIAEGCGRRGNGEFHRFLQIASGSASELDYQLLLARDLGLLEDGTYQEVYKGLAELRRMLTALILRVDTERRMAKC